jgi:hypothetical protein
MNIKSDFLWRESSWHCAEADYVLCGWPSNGIFPGSVTQSDSPHFTASKDLGKAAGRKVMIKFNNDRKVVQADDNVEKDLLKLQYYPLGEYLVYSPTITNCSSSRSSCHE